MITLVRPLVAEFLGTFGLVFIGAGAVVVNAATGEALGLVGIALAHALVLSVMVTAFMNISGAHLNPAVTFALWSASKISAGRAVWYVLVQLLAGVVAALLVKSLYPAMAGEATSYGVPRIAGDITIIEAIVIEGILTLFLVSAVFGTAVSSEAPKVGGFGIGLVLLFDILAGGPPHGRGDESSASPGARAGGKRLARTHSVLARAAVGGVVAALLWSKILLPRD